MHDYDIAAEEIKFIYVSACMGMGRVHKMQWKHYNQVERLNGKFIDFR